MQSVFAINTSKNEVNLNGEIFLCENDIIAIKLYHYKPSHNSEKSLNRYKKKKQIRSENLWKGVAKRINQNQNLHK